MEKKEELYWNRCNLYLLAENENYKNGIILQAHKLHFKEITGLDPDNIWDEKTGKIKMIPHTKNISNLVTSKKIKKSFKYLEGLNEKVLMDIKFIYSIRICDNYLSNRDLFSLDTKIENILLEI